MPPWTADTAYQHFSQERILTQSERDILLNWVVDGALSGDLNTAPPPPMYNGSQQLVGKPDLVISAPRYMSKASLFSDDYVCFVMPTNLLQDKKVRAFEVIPDNLETVHHCLVFADADKIATTDTIGGNCGGPVSGDLMGGYTPGASPVIFPSTDNFSAGMILKAGSNLIFAMHYPEGSYGTFDQSKINLYFYNEPINNFREISSKPLISNWTFNIQPNSVDTVKANFNGIFNNFTLLSVFPHMHLIGKEIESFATTPTQDTIPFIKIPHWDFEWQDFYWFKYMKKIPFGSEIYGRGIYDNTANNPHNPNSPPKTIRAGLNTSDEMFLIYYHYMTYQNGDELINIDSLTNLFLSYKQFESPLFKDQINVFPNPSSKNVNFELELTEHSYVTLYIYDIKGNLVNKISSGYLSRGNHNLKWDRHHEIGSNTSTGTYFYSLLINGQHKAGQIIIE